MTVISQVLQQELESQRNLMLRLAHAVESMGARMNRLEQWQTTMDTILKAMRENN